MAKQHHICRTMFRKYQDNVYHQLWRMSIVI